MGAPDLLGFQHAGTQGSSKVHLRRLLYTVTKQHVTAAKELATVFLDQSNAYGQLDHVGMMHLVAQELTFCGLWDEAVYLSASSRLSSLRMGCPRGTASAKE